MRLKQRVDDFRVRELLDPAFFVERGPYRVYRIVKRKLTSLQAAEMLAGEAGVAAGEIGMAGLKDRQGATVQHMSVPGGKPVEMRTPELKIELAGFSDEPLESRFSLGNSFEVVVRDLDWEQAKSMGPMAREVAEHGLPNYFDEQRFGNLRHGQGWIARDLVKGQTEKALKRLLTAESEFDDSRTKTFKQSLNRRWGDHRACREVARRFGKHRSLFEHLMANEGDWAGAFTYVSTRLSLIHLYAYQSHIWNRAVASYMASLTTRPERLVAYSLEGPQVFPSNLESLPDDVERNFRLPGEQYSDVTSPIQRGFLEEALAEDWLVPDQFVIKGVSGFAIKGEDRELFVKPKDLLFDGPIEDSENRGRAAVRLRFSLNRGSYATLVIRRLCALPVDSARPWVEHSRLAREESPDRTRRQGFNNQRGGARSSYANSGRGGGRPYESREGRGGHSGGGRGYQGGGREGSSYRGDSRDRSDYRGPNSTEPARTFRGHGGGGQGGQGGQGGHRSYGGQGGGSYRGGQGGQGQSYGRARDEGGNSGGRPNGGDRSYGGARPSRGDSGSRSYGGGFRGSDRGEDRGQRPSYGQGGGRHGESRGSHGDRPRGEGRSYGGGGSSHRGEGGRPYQGSQGGGGGGRSSYGGSRPGGSYQGGRPGGSQQGGRPGGYGGGSSGGGSRGGDSRGYDRSRGGSGGGSGGKSYRGADGSNRTHSGGGWGQGGERSSGGGQQDRKPWQSDQGGRGPGRHDGSDRPRGKNTKGGWSKGKPSSPREGGKKSWGTDS